MIEQVKNAHGISRNFCELLISTEPPLGGGVLIHGTGKLRIYSVVKPKVIFTWHRTNSWIKLATLAWAVYVQKVRVENLPELGSLVYSNVTTDVQKLCLETFTWTDESENISLRKLSTYVVFVLVDTVFVKTARGSPVGWYGF